MWKWTVEREKYKSEYANLWNNTATGEDGDGEVDVILCPVGPGAAPPLDCSRYWGYTSQWNLLDYPALVFPVSKVDPDVDLREEGYEPMNEQDAYNYELCQFLILMNWVGLAYVNLDDPEFYRDAPVSLQLVGRRYEDEKVSGFFLGSFFSGLTVFGHSCLCFIGNTSFGIDH
jgi:Asp-tRNA(Asn)/Glu-tRNA(Gln) amidotransferase A subunit family amidase